MKRQDVYVLLQGEYTKQDVDRAFTALGKTSPGYSVKSQDLPDKVVEDLKPHLSKSKAIAASNPANAEGKDGNLTATQNGKPVSYFNSAVPQQINVGVDAENYGQLVEAFKKQGITQAQALIAISQDAFLMTLSNSNNQFNSELIQSLIADIIRMKQVQMNASGMVNIPAVTAVTTQELAIAAQAEADKFNWQEIAATADNNSFDWDNILGG